MEEIFLLAGGFTFWDILKFLMLLFLALYVVFALVVLKQVRLMTETVKAGFEVPIEVFALLHLLFAFSVLIVSLIV